MRIADIAVFVFIFQLVLGILLATSSFSSLSVNMTSTWSPEEAEQLKGNLSRAINDTKCSSWDIACQVMTAWRQFDAQFITPVRVAFTSFGKAIFIGRFLTDIFRPIDYDGSLSRFFVIFDAVGTLVFAYGLIQLISGRAFKTMR